MLASVRLNNILVCGLLFSGILSREAVGQVNPATSLLLRQQTQENTNPNLDSGRYTVRPNAPNRVTKSESTQQPVQPEKSEKIEKPVQPIVQVTETPSPVLQENPAQKNSEQNLIESLRETIMGGDPDKILQYRDQLHPEDPRQNILRIKMAPGIFFVNSSSEYWYRDYYGSGPAVFVGGEVWISPFFGLKVDYLTTLANSIKNDPASNSTVMADHQLTNYGLVFRKYTSLARTASWFEVGLGQADYRMVVPRSEDQRIRLSSRSLTLSIDAHMPVSNTTNWYLGSKLLPKIDVKEERTNIQVKSGTKPSTYGVQFHIGQEFSIDRQNQVFWELSHRFDKSVYRGTATEIDPITGLAPEGVSVHSGITIFKFGYSWGD